VLSVNIDGMAISPRDTDFSTVFFCPLNSFHFFSVPTKVLNSATNGQVLQDNDVIDLGVKESTSDGMIADWKGILYYGRDLDNGVSFWSTSQKVIQIFNKLN
jgi:sugar lactone lactonase YvrE